jgi:hypothetical protein
MIRPWHSGHIKELLDEAEEFGVPDRICLNGQDFSDIRKSERDLLDFTIDQNVLRTGLFAHLFGIGVYVSRQEISGIIRITDSSGRTLTHWNSVIDVEPCSGEIDDCRICLVTQVMAG